jgi:F-type H+-transporting ATPase subunit alpha
MDGLLNQLFTPISEVSRRAGPPLQVQEVGVVRSLAEGIAWVRGLSAVGAEEVVLFPPDSLGVAFTLEERDTGVIMLDAANRVTAGSEVQRTGRLLDVPVGTDLLGRVVDAVGRPLDGRGPVSARERRPVERPAPDIVERAPVSMPLQTGLKVVDSLVPIGRGQRELILGDRQTGKTAIATQAVLQQKGSGVLCVYCTIGQRDSAVTRLIRTLSDGGAMAYTTVMVARAEDPPGQQYVAPYAATALAESFMRAGRDVLVVYDDLTRHARAYRELCLLLRRPPGREAFPGDVFHLHSRLLERATHLRPELGGGSLTALPIVETEGGDMAAYIPTNLISITDGQIVLSSALFQKGVLPAVDVGLSVSRVGGDAQLPAYRSVVGDLRLAYAQFEELEAFSRFDTRLSAETRQSLTRGQRVREVLKQVNEPGLAVVEQVAVLLAATQGLFDSVTPDAMVGAEAAVRRMVLESCRDIGRRIEAGETLSSVDRVRLLDVAARAVASQQPTEPQDRRDGHA